MANILQKQYESVFSDPNRHDKILPNAGISCSNPNISDIELSKEDIERAIDEIDRDAATTENDIPASVLKECKNTLSYPIYLIWNKSFDTKTIYYTQRHKKSRASTTY